MTNYVAYTLVDITNTNESKHNRNHIKFYQQQNLNTLVQTIGLRSQPLNPSVDVIMAQDIVNFGFGKQYHGLHTVWRLQFSIEHGQVLEDMSVLLQDCNGIPVYTGLEETAELSSKCFETNGPINVCFKKHTDIH
ncbi:MAG: hypothetical protein CMQ75_05035 [Gammaproteobacteria bacterium]|nr:hypothetical protein [Gammaproteobacteria bacterium]|tara:strand:+ start:4023 stop:4427 length:405 start_codon:yes stop_codon:yes gene_type:complete